LTSRIEKLKALSADEWRLLITATGFLPFTGLSLQLIGFTRTQQLLKRNLPLQAVNQKIDIDTLEEGHKVARMVSIAARYGFYRANCLKQSLVLWNLLQRRGIESDLRIGVNKDKETFNAHAWVELNGNLLIDSMPVRERFVKMM
jgi:hypothetical protein